jgi:hypothetical protein
MKLQSGDIVRITGEHKTGKVRGVISDQHAIMLEKAVGGYRLWNLDEVELVRRAELSRNARREVSTETRAKLKARWSKAKKPRYS